MLSHKFKPEDGYKMNKIYGGFGVHSYDYEDHSVLGSDSV
jgi:hypothetical protein